MVGICVSQSAKPNKRMVNRRFRRVNRTEVKYSGEPFEHVNMVPSVVELAYDGKRFRADVSERTMRK